MSLASNALITADEYKTFAGVDPTDANWPTDQFEQFINVVSQMFEDFTGRKWITTSGATEIHDGDGESNLFVKHRPITALTKLEYWDGDSWAEATTTTYPYTYDGDTGEIWFTEGSTFWTGKKNWRVTYSYGYARASVPIDIKLTVAQMVKRIDLKFAGKEGLRSETTDIGSTAYDLNDMPPDVRKIWLRHKRPVI